MRSATDEMAAIERVERAAFTDFFAAAPGSVVERYGLRWHLDDDVALVAARGLAGQPKMNRAIGLGTLGPATEGRLDEALGWLRRHAHADRFVQVAPGAAPAELPGWLAARGLHPVGDGWAKLRRGAAPARGHPIPTTLRVREATGRADADAFGAIVAAAFGLAPDLGAWYAALVGRPRWRTYLALDGDRPVATGALYLGDGLGWIGAGGALAEARGRGAQSALLARRVADGLEAGLRGFTSETAGPPPPGTGPANPSHRNAARIGFELAYIRPNYQPARVDPD